MNPEAKTSWDDDEEKKLKIKSTFVGTTPEIDKRIQAIVDTTNTGKIFRDYDYYKSKISNLSKIVLKYTKMNKFTTI